MQAKVIGGTGAEEGSGVRFQIVSQGEQRAGIRWNANVIGSGPDGTGFEVHTEVSTGTECETEQQRGGEDRFDHNGPTKTPISARWIHPGLDLPAPGKALRKK